MSPEILTVIPARLQSTRFPEKPLALIDDVPMVVRTYRQCVSVASEEHCLVATDSQVIVDVCSRFGIRTCLTSVDCLTGTDRVAEVALRFPQYSAYLNVQGDEPIFNPADISDLVECYKETQVDVVGGYTPITNSSDFIDMSVPKVVVAGDGTLLYMSRNAIPGNKTGEFRFGYRQVCAYIFSGVALQIFSSAKAKTPLESEEDIELLRFLELGVPVKMVKLSDESISVDYPEDIGLVLDELKRKSTHDGDF
mgnify:CR=1 FL=1